SRDSRSAADDLLTVAAGELAEQLLPAEVLGDDDPLVIVPTARLHDVPWGLLPGLRGRPTSITPSVTAWGVAERLRLDRLAIHGGERAAGLVAGPGLAHAAAEVSGVASFYDRPTVVGGA